MKKYLISFISLILSCSNLFSQSGENKKYIFSPDEILKIMDVSKIQYEIKELEDRSYLDNFKPIQLSDQFYIIKDGDNKTLMKYSLSSDGNAAYGKAEDAYKAANYDQAINLYKDVLKIDKDYNKIYTLLGDMYYMKRNYDSAEYYFKYAIEKNFVDYTAHWFLADTYMKTDEKDDAAEEITIAHLLNRNHDNIYKAMKNYRKANDQPWKDWSITPRCKTYKDGDKVIIETEPDWLGYACCEAVWKYEPGFAMNIIGQNYTDSTFSYEKEKSCLAATLTSEKMKYISKIVEDGYFEEMVWYEVLSKKVPAGMLLLPEDFFNRIVKYINKYH